MTGEEEGEEGGEEQVLEAETNFEEQVKSDLQEEVEANVEEEVEANVEEEVEATPEEALQEVEEDLEGFEVVEGGGEGPSEDVEDLGGMTSKEQWEDILEAEQVEDGEGSAEVEQDLEESNEESNQVEE